MLELIVVAAAALSAAKEAPPEPSTRPVDWSVTRTAAEQLLTSSLYDPGSAQIMWTSGFEWGYSKPLIGKRVWGWVGCLSLNAKNRMGGYVGAQSYWVLHQPSGKISTGPVVDRFTQCDTPGKVPLQPELLTAEAPPSLSVADELSKLADLLDRGLITREEFEAQKARLLAR